MPRLLAAHRLLIAGFALTACLGQRGSVPPGTPAGGEVRWLAGHPATCAEIRGQVIDAATGRALAAATVTIDSTAFRAITDSAGFFRIRLPQPPPAKAEPSHQLTLRIRSLGRLEVVAVLPDTRGYYVDAMLASAGFHADEVSTVRVRGPAACERAP